MVTYKMEEDVNVPYYIVLILDHVNFCHLKPKLNLKNKKHFLRLEANQNN